MPRTANFIQTTHIQDILSSVLPFLFIFATLLVVTISSSRSTTVQQPSRQLLFLSLFPPLLPPICLESAAGPPPPPPHLIISISNSSGNHHHCMIEASPSFLLLVTRDTWAPSHSGPTSNTDPNNRSRHPNRSRSRPIHPADNSEQRGARWRNNNYYLHFER